MPRYVPSIGVFIFLAAHVFMCDGLSAADPRGFATNTGDHMSDANEVISQTAAGQLKSIIERVERLEQEKSEIAEQIKEVFAEAKGNGFDVKILRKVIRIRKQDRAKRQEEDAIMDLYMVAIGEA